MYVTNALRHHQKKEQRQRIIGLTSLACSSSTRSISISISCSVRLSESTSWSSAECKGGESTSLAKEVLEVPGATETSSSLSKGTPASLEYLTRRKKEELVRVGLLRGEVMVSWTHRSARSFIFSAAIPPGVCSGLDGRLNKRNYIFGTRGRGYRNLLGIKDKIQR